MVINLLDLNNRIFGEVGGVKVDVMEIDGGNLMIVVSCVVENTLFEVVTRTVKRMLIFVVTEIAAAVLLVDGMKNVEELADATHLVISGK